MKQLLLAAASLSLSAPCTAQELPPLEVHRLGNAGEPEAPGYFVQLPAGFAPDQWRPVVVLLGQVSTDDASGRFVLGGSTGDRAAAERLATALARRGMVVACPQVLRFVPDCFDEGDHVFVEPALARLPALLRRRFRIAGGGLHLVAVANAGPAAVQLATAAAFEFQSLSLFGGDHRIDTDSQVRLRGRRIAWFGAPGNAAPPAVDQHGVALSPPKVATIETRPAVPAEQLAAVLPDHLLKLQAARALPGAAGEVALALDDFHDAASKGDEDRYFALLPDDAVFLGTDGEERWTGAEFRAFALPYFKRPSAWTYVPVSRHVEVAADGAVAWFDEVLDNESYGECRGSGVLQRRGGRWVVRHYNLTIPVPNGLAGGLVARIRDFARGLEPASATVVCVRHAEKGPGDDPDLTEAGKARAERLATMLADLPVAAVFATEFRRTQATVAPLAVRLKLEPKIVPAADTKQLLQQLRRDWSRQTVVVAGHSNTIPLLVKALGVHEQIAMADDDYDEVFVVTVTADGARLLRLHY